MKSLEMIIVLILGNIFLEHTVPPRLVGISRNLFLGKNGDFDAFESKLKHGRLRRLTFGLAIASLVGAALLLYYSDQLAAELLVLEVSIYLIIIVTDMLRLRKNKAADND